MDRLIVWGLILVIGLKIFSLIFKKSAGCLTLLMMFAVCLGGFALIHGYVVHGGLAHYPQYAGEERQVIYYNQEDRRWGKKHYGTSDEIRETGCGPTVVAMAVSSYTDHAVYPDEMAEWSRENGYCADGSGSYHSMISAGLSHYGIDSLCTSDREAVQRALENEQPVIALMGEGHFTKSGHFILLTDLDLDGEVSVADPKSILHTKRKWELSTIFEEAKVSPSEKGSFWILDV